jgi:hypothetical protein
MPQALSPSDWAAIRAAYEKSSERVPDIAARFGLANIRIHGCAYQQNWVRYAHPPSIDDALPQQPEAQPAVMPTEQTAPKPPKPKASRPKRQGMIDRLYRVIDNNLSQLEDIMKNQSDPSIADNEKETRTIGTVIGNIEKLKGLENDAGKSRLTNKSSSPADTAAATERLGRELAERLSRLAKDLRA